jgi:hypothetical protein
LTAIRAETWDPSKEDPFKTFQATMRHLEDEANSNRRASMAGARPPGPDKVTDNNRQLAQAAAALLTQELNREDYKEQLSGVRDTQKMITMLQSKNPAAQKMALGIWAKQASGPGAVQQSERDEFVNTVGGYDEKLKKAALQFFSDGQAPPEQLAIFADAAKNLTLRRQTENLRSVRDSIRDTFASHPNPDFQQYADWAANRVGSSILGKTQPAGGGQRAGASSGKKAADYLREYAK